MRGVVNGILAILVLAYPLIVYFGLAYVDPWSIAALMALIVLLRLSFKPDSCRAQRWLQIILFAYLALTVFGNSIVSLRFYPVMINLGLFVVFFSSLFYPPPVIERLARLQNPALPDKSIPYTRKVTQVWCVFFLINGLLAAIFATWGSFALWTLYNGLIAYVLMGLLMAIEYLIRIRTQQ